MGHADFSSQIGDDDAKNPGCNPGESGAGLGGCKTLWHLRADSLEWRNRGKVHDRRHRPQSLQTTLIPAQEAIAVALRKTLLLPLDDFLAVVHELLNSHVSRSGLNRCVSFWFENNGECVSNLREMKPQEVQPAHRTFKTYEPGYLHVDIKYLTQMTDEDQRRYLFVAIDSATRWVFVCIYPARTAADARRFLLDLARAAPMKITHVLTDNRKTITDRLLGLRKRAATGQHEFDQICADLRIAHRLTPPMRPQTNGMVEWFNGHFEDVLRSHPFQIGEELEQTILRNGHLPQTVLKGRMPIDALKQRYGQKHRPDLFRKRPYNHAGCDGYKKGPPPTASK